MERRTSAYYQRRHRERLREQGLVKKELWILPEFADELAAVERRMRQPRGPAPNPRERQMSEQKVWTTRALYEALSATEQFSAGAVSAELLDGADQSLHLVMRDYGDLPLFLAVVGEQIVVEALLWPVSQVGDAAAFNEEVLRTHKMFPLSTIGIEQMGGEAAYIMFGALDARSSLSNVAFEIESLADNVIKATEAYESHLKAAA
ncbi:YjfI family protein [Luteimonas sp. SJ-92]|uniref:YjfI family protein n=1 Tax=Luteimonas salinisoli TaxID=2752307 RepID=A0A853JAT4_9GAMM|nr:YjfI family protein [Luteimonas salinisoli]NZA26311.1 YjfI family protein [Luteimonas salinisoli]